MTDKDWKLIARLENFNVEYNETKGLYRVDYFENNRYVTGITFTEAEKDGGNE